MNVTGDASPMPYTDLRADLGNIPIDEFLVELRKIMGASSDKEAEQKLMNSETDLEWEDIQRAKE